MAYATRISDPADHVDMERNAYNAAFHELGLRWHWDDETYDQLCRETADTTVRLGNYLGRHQPHLLRAYDADFLVTTIEAAKARHLRSNLASGGTACRFDWADSLGAELGA